MRIQLYEEERIILSFSKKSGDEITAATGLQLRKVLAALTMLEVKGLFSN